MAIAAAEPAPPEVITLGGADQPTGRLPIQAWDTRTLLA
jgi:hypothetical protein